MSLILALLASVSIGTRASTADPSESLYDRAVTAAWWGEYENLQGMFDLARKSTARSADGELQIDEVRRGFARIFGVDRYNEAYYIQVDAMTRQWAEANPGSSMAHLLHSRALLAHAWFLRGGGFANQITPQAWAGFRKYVKMAEDHLATNASVVMADSTAYLYLVMIGRAADRSFDAQWAIAQESFRVNPEDSAILGELAISALPKWGGSVERIERLARDAARRTQSTLGLQHYTEVYLAVAYEFKGGLFRETRADWPTMKQGFRDMLSRHPGSKVVNRFAFVACLAQDKETTVELLDRVGEKPLHDLWGGQATYEICRRWARAP